MKDMTVDYNDRIAKVQDYIGRHIDEELSLDDLCRVAYFSKFHFHRLFTAYTGMSLQQYIAWLRLKRAAYQLIVNKDTSIINIAVAAGFSSHEAFTRAFKKIFNVTPSGFRCAPVDPHTVRTPFKPQARKDITMDVTIKEMPARRLAMVEHRGDPAGILASVDKLVTWAKNQRADLKPKAGESFAFAYDDPKTTAPEDFRFDIGITVPEELKLTGVVVEKRLPAGRYAAAMHKGSRDRIGETIYGIYRDWLPGSGEQLGELPCIFRYYTFDHETAQTQQLTECLLLLK